MPPSKPMEAHVADPFHTRHPSITSPMVRDELARELGHRRRFYPRRIDEARMTQQQADFQIACAEAWLADVDRLIAHWAACAAEWERFQHDPSPGFMARDLPAAKHGINWRDRRTALRRELELRNKIYPRRIEQAQMTKCIGDRQIACLEALADRYDDGLDWTASNGERTHFGNLNCDAAIEAARKEWDQHRREVEARRAPAKQEELLMSP